MMKNNYINGSEKNDSELDFDDEFDINKEVITRWEGVIRPWEDRWFLECITIDFSVLSIYASAQFLTRLKIVLACRSIRSSYKSIINDFNRIKSILRFLHKTNPEIIELISFRHILDWQITLKSRGREWALGALRGLLLDSADLIDNPLIDEKAIEYLEQITLPGNPKGSRVNDKDLGRLTLIERALFENRARVCYEQNEISTEQFASLVLLNTFGLRPIDYTSLKVCDFKCEFKDDKFVSATLDIPYGKLGSPPRSKIAFGNKLSFEVASLLSCLINGRSPDAPLFECKESKSLRQTGVLQGHLNTEMAKQYLRRALNKLRVGFNLNSYRFRYTVGTEAYRETGNPYVAAYVLRHSDIQNVKVYVNEIILAQAHDRVSDEVFSDFASLVDAAMKAKSFSGVVITKQNFKERNLGVIRAKEQTGNFDPIGGCAGKNGCAQGVPVSCYCCNKFKPLAEADHYKVLVSTISEYKKTATSDVSAASSLIPAILGMAQVCYLIQQQSKEVLL